MHSNKPKADSRNPILAHGLLLLLVTATGCQHEEDRRKDTLFDMVQPQVSGIDFINQITSDDYINILTYEYMYNGGGVGIADFNSDGRQDIYLVGSQVPGKLYLNLGGRRNDSTGFHFEDVTEHSGITRHANWAFGVSVADVNQDGLPDLYFSMGGPGNRNIFPNELFIHQGLDSLGLPHFREMAMEYGLADSSQSIQAVFFDYDRDGDLDMYLVAGGGFERSPNNPFPIIKDGSARNTDHLYRNDYDRRLGHPYFTDVSMQAGIVEEGFGLGVSMVDINEDGWPDLYVTNDYLSNDLLYVNQHNGTFKEESATYFKHTSHFAMGNDVGDINNDGLVDVMAVDMLPEDHTRRKLMFGPTQYNKFYYAVDHGYSYQYMRNTLQLNNGKGSFSEIGQLAGIYQTDWSWAVLLADFDNDEYQDIYITNGFGKDITDLDFVKFRGTIASQQMDPQLRGKILLDSLDERPGIKLGNYGYRNNHDLSFTRVSGEWGFDTPSFSNGAAYADFDNDGDLDLAVNNINDVAFIYRNLLREKHPDSSNYLRLILVGKDPNRQAIGARAVIRYDNKLQSRMLSVVRGFESSVEPTLHFGLASYSNVDTIEVYWPDGQTSLLTDVKANQLVTIRYGDGTPVPENTRNGTTVFAPCDPQLIPYTHRENDFVDFDHEPLLPHKISREGPGIAVGDINNDGLDDLFIGGALLRSGEIFQQQKDGTFQAQPLSADDIEREDMGVLFFDADNDNDLDLYVVSGGNEYNPGHRHYQDRLYLNDGKGRFTNSEQGLPEMLTSGSCVVSADYDHDGDLDLFVGGRVWPTAYPKAPRSYLLRNNGKGWFEDVTETMAPELMTPGMVTSALWTDFDNDGWADLFLAGEYMPLSAFRNEQGARLRQAFTVPHSEGWWNSLTPGDFDNDGDIDYVAGNFGLNSHFHASPAEPINVSFKDFDNNGVIEAITSYYQDGVNYPDPSMDVLMNQMPFLKSKILYYRTYANTSTSTLLAMAGNENVGVLNCETLQSAYIENLGNGKFSLKELPRPAQVAPLYGVLPCDVNDDGNLDFLAVGNSYSPEVVAGRCDAFIGLVMLGDGKGSFRSLRPAESGFMVDGDAKAMARLIDGREEILTIITQNNGSVRLFRQGRPSNATHQVKADKLEFVAQITFRDGRRQRMEIGYGSGYLSQSARTVVVSSQVLKLEFFDFSGKPTRAFTY